MPHPYISGPGNVTQLIGLLRKSFPATVTSETIKKYGLASNNESYLINALQFIGLIDKDGKRTDVGHNVLTIHDETKFRQAFEELIKKAYEDLFELRGNDAWTLEKGDLIGYFRTTDKTSDAIGARQAAVFRVFASLAGHGEPPEVKAKPSTKAAPKDAAGAKKPKAAKETIEKSKALHEGGGESKRDMALTVRIEINLPAQGTKETYDAIFQSIRANLINE